MDSQTPIAESSNATARSWITATDFKHDFLASIVVFLVALPLCMGIAIASGAPVAAGLLTGIIGGIVVSTFAGCPLQVSGPAAGLTVIVYEIISKYGFEMLGLVVLMAGLVQIAAGCLRLGQWFRAVSPSVVKGMLAGIGVLIFASQFHVMVDDRPKENGLANLWSIPEAVWKGLGVPDWTSRESRHERIAALQTIGELHRQQADVHERLIEQAPDLHDSADEQNLRDGDLALPHDLHALTAKQRSIAADLREFVRRVSEHTDDARLSAAAEDAGKSLRAAELAAARLDSDEIATAHESIEEAEALLGAVLSDMKHHQLAAQLGLLTILVIVLWQTFAPNQLRVVPAPLIAVTGATLGAFLLSLPVLYVEVPLNLAEELHWPTWAVILDAPWRTLAGSALLVALVASAETLLCATAVDQMHQGPRTRYDQELIAQGVGNTMCGLVGALPMTGVIVRSSANVMAGGKTRLSGVLHGVWLLMFVALAAALLRMIPTSCLAAILVYTGYKLIDWKSVRELRKYGWGEVGIFFATAAAIVALDLLTGVLIGIGLAAVKLLYTFSHLQVQVVPTEGKRQTLRLEGAATFVRLPALAAALERIPGDAELHVVIEQLTYIDHACLELLTNWSRQHQATGGTLVLDWDTLRARIQADARKTNGSNTA